MQCEFCGTEVENGFTVCTGCGAHYGTEKGITFKYLFAGYISLVFFGYAMQSLSNEYYILFLILMIPSIWVARIAYKLFQRRKEKYWWRKQI